MTRAPESEISSSRRPPLSSSCVAIIAAAGGIAVANLYYNQPMLPDIGRSFGVAADVIAFLPMLTQIGYALGLFLFVPLGDIVDRHQLVLRLLFGIFVFQLALAPSLVWLDVASLMLGMMSAVAQVLVALSAQRNPPQHRGRIVGTLQTGILAGILLARTVSGTVSEPGIISAGRGQRLSGSSIAAPRSSRASPSWMPTTAGVINRT
jgi:predicted MFS family arabinose efflux permease